MKTILLALAFLMVSFVGCAQKCDNANCNCVNCTCVDCNCENCNCENCNCENCNCENCNCENCNCVDGNCPATIGQVPADDSHRAYVTVYGVKGDQTYETLCLWGRNTSGSHYAEISTDMQMAERMPGIETPRVVITKSDGKVLYKGVPKSYTEFRSVFNRNCPDGYCRPTPAPAPAPAPAPVVSPPFAEPIPDTDEGEDSGMPAIWMFAVVALLAGGAGYATWHKQEYFSS